jgi:hypothetical protein
MQSSVKVSFSYESHQSVLSAIDTVKYSHYHEGYVSLNSEDYPPKPSQEEDEQSFFLTARFNAHSIEFQICDFSLDNFDEMTLASKKLKAHDISEELNLYIGMVEAFYKGQIKIKTQTADETRRDAHKALASKIDEVLKDKLGLTLRDDEVPSALSQDLVTRWLHMRGLIEENNRESFPSNIHSCGVFAMEAKIDRRQILGR